MMPTPRRSATSSSAACSPSIWAKGRKANTSQRRLWTRSQPGGRKRLGRRRCWDRQAIGRHQGRARWVDRRPLSEQWSEVAKHAVAWLKSEAVAGCPTWVVSSDVDRFHLSAGLIEHVPSLSPHAACAIQTICRRLLGHKQYIDKYGEDLPEIWHGPRELQGGRVALDCVRALGEQSLLCASEKDGGIVSSFRAVGFHPISRSRPITYGTPKLMANMLPSTNGKAHL
jgi:hypothetical protein